MTKRFISASVIAADFANLAHDINLAIAAGAQGIHFDVMDNHYVPNLSIGPMVLKKLKPHLDNTPVDVHLMVSNPSSLIPAFVDAGANIITFHPETDPDPLATLQAIQAQGLEAGLAFNPDQPLNIEPAWLDAMQHLLIMTVQPGFGGQGYIPAATNQITKAKNIINNLDKNINLWVDGGINPITINTAADAGANRFVVGSALFSKDNYKNEIINLN